ncbi:hypothetical protein L2E82_24375 [Cichorium intybus]|uniref:Uncharacterized protein n=1 Tax=Cichorium intybus TaxID=13427 RepID=A0ACB9E0X9_CICIN|nr:hypothetical protein L2E82_24375 [Cichorium intybus]
MHPSNRRCQCMDILLLVHYGLLHESNMSCEMLVPIAVGVPKSVIGVTTFRRLQSMEHPINQGSDMLFTGCEHMNANDDIVCDNFNGTNQLSPECKVPKVTDEAYYLTRARENKENENAFMV